MRFEWDESKNRANQDTHGISFEEVRQLFEAGVDYLEIFDSEHSLDEDRFIAIGPIQRGVVLVVWTEVQDEVIRLISARAATRREARMFRTRMRMDHE